MASLSGRGHKRKINDSLRLLIQMVPKKPKITSKEIGGELYGHGRAKDEQGVRLRVNHNKERLDFTKMHANMHWG